MLEEFKRELLPHLTFSAEAFREISEAEWQAGIKRLRAELPAYLRYLMSEDFESISRFAQKELRMDQR